MDQNDVELATEAQGSHVCDQVLAVGVDLPADCQHSWRAIREREREMWAEVRRQTAPAGAEFEESPLAAGEGRPKRSNRSAASSTYSSGGENSGHHSAKSS